ncbi:protein SOSEKI 2 [Castanea sativa]|uniref:protein SOSEKI 2 n=1 Tax=Castanea sativa TaxID=21020 RepID=UPI003F64BE02
MEVRSSRRGREKESSPDRVKVYNMHPRVVKPIKKVQVVYYLSRNGHLEHPHYMEVTHLVNQPLRLRDVTERLTVLRGKGMPSLYSWSCKRSYKTGYVWNDLAENDIIYPSDGAEYVLKGSELVEGCSERFQQLHITNGQQIIQEPNYHPKRKQLAPSPSPQREQEDQEYEEFEEEEEEYEDGEKASYTSSTTPHSRCSRGVSTDELEDHETQPPRPQSKKNPTDHQYTLIDSSYISDKANQISNNNNNNNSSKRFQNNPVGGNQSKRFEGGDPVVNQSIISSSSNNNSKRFEDGDPAGNESAQSRNSVLLQLIACGGSNKAKSGPSVKHQVSVKKSESLHKGVVCKSAVKVGEEDYLIRYMSENPRFGNFQSEEKEYFSGSIVESMTEHRPIGTEPVLKKSSSFKEERSNKAELVEAVEEEKREKASVKGKCIPRKKSSASSKPTKK